jgi:hypothetical protein
MQDRALLLRSPDISMPGDGEGLVLGGTGDGEGDGCGLGELSTGDGDAGTAGGGLGDGTTMTLFNRCAILPQSLKGPLLATERLRTNPKFEATTSAKMSALRKRSEVVDAVAARMVRSSVSLTKRWTCLGL